MGEQREGGSGVLIVGVFRDVSDRQLAAEARQRSEALRILIDALPDAVMVHRAGRLVYANRKFLEQLGAADPDAVLRRDIRELLHPGDVNRA
jgi:PAS domain-containing protein